jgi:hypothetical protein
MLLKSMKLAATGCALAVAMSSFAQAQTLPGTKRDLDFDAHMKTVDLDDPSFRLEYKKPTPDGSSIGMFIGRGDQPTDRSFVPTNPSSIPEAEVVAYRLARFLGISRLFYPVDYYRLGPKAQAKFRDMVVNARDTDADGATNRQIVLKDLKANPTSLLGIYRIRPKTKMYTVVSLGSQGKFNLNTGLAKEISAKGPMPGDQRISLEGVPGGRPGYPTPPTETRVELARQLSTIFVMDQLLGQWDRFWNNLEAAGDKNGRLKLVARDNGGASLEDWEGYEAYSSWVSRFDREVIDRLAALNAFLKGEAKAFAGLTSVESWKTAVGFIVPASYETFQKKLALLTEKRVPALVKQYGDKTFFPAKSAEVAKLDAADTGEDD